MTDVIEAIAESIIGHVRNEDLTSIDLVLKAADEGTWREVLRYELDLVALLDGLMCSDILAPRLLIMFEITTLSPFHYAALRGADDVIERFIERSRLPVDAALRTGTTALHLACFAGAVGTAEMLIDKYGSGIDRKDIYGWTPLHYSSLGGQLDVVRLLAARGADMFARDKDGTTAAFRAEAFGRDDIVSFLLDSTGDDDQLLIDDDTDTPEKRSSSLYASIGFKIPTSRPVETNQAAESDYEIAVTTKDSTGSSIAKNSNYHRSSSENTGLSKRFSNYISGTNSLNSQPSLFNTAGPINSSVLTSKNSDSFPKADYNCEPIYSRHLITESSLTAQLVSPALSMSQPRDRLVKTEVRRNTDDLESSKQEHGSTVDPGDDDIGHDTLTKIMREEFLKFRAIKLKTQMSKRTTNKDCTSNADRLSMTNVNDDYQEIGIYAELNSDIKECDTLNNPGHMKIKAICTQNVNDSKRTLDASKSASSTVPPPLPPRNIVAETRKRVEVIDENDDRAKLILILSKIEHDSAVMEACFQTLASILHSADDWKKLAYSLPLRDCSTLVEKKIKLIEDRYPGDVHRQTVELLRQWRSQKGEKATVSGVTLAMRNCGLGELVAAIEVGSEESSA